MQSKTHPITIIAIPVFLLIIHLDNILAVIGRKINGNAILSKLRRKDYSRESSKIKTTKGTLFKSALIRKKKPLPDKRFGRVQSRIFSKTTSHSVLLQKQLLVLVVEVVSKSEELVNARAASIPIITAVSRLEKSPSEINTIITISKNRYQLSSNTLHLFDFLPQYVAKYAKVTKTSLSYMR